jgi:hypothetical protein
MNEKQPREPQQPQRDNPQRPANNESQADQKGAQQIPTSQPAGPPRE